MVYDSFEPEKEKKAKEMLAGPLGKVMAEFPLRFASAAFFGRRPFDTHGTDINNGTVSLIDFGNGPIAITCSHVLEAYRQRLKEDNKIIFQIGDLLIDPVEQLIDESRELDLATIDLRGVTLDEVVMGDEISSDVFRPSTWPPMNVNQGNFVTFGGFPGKWRWQEKPRHLVFDSFSSGACMISSVSDEYFVCQFERNYWVSAINLRPGEELHNLGGLSGAPFIIRNKGVIYYEFVGIVYEFSAEFDLMYVRHAKFIRDDGTISL